MHGDQFYVKESIIQLTELRLNNAYTSLGQHKRNTESKITHVFLKLHFWLSVLSIIVV